ncbi:MAG: ABC transporter permease [Proteobacteria bacterium]|nr:ABC transporter permease [Pseudomonadota bacterium]
MIKVFFENLFNRYLGKPYNYISFLVVVIDSTINNFPKGIKAVERVTLKQIYFTGIEAVKITLQIGFFMGIVVITQITSFIKGLGGINLVGKIITIAIVREIFPLLIAVIMIARSGTAITSELALMKINNEIKTLRILNIDPLYYLIFARILGFVISITVVTVIGTATAILSGSLTIYLIQKISVSDFFEYFFINLNIFDVTLFLLKCFFFGIVISTICSFYGLSVGKSPTEIPQVSTKAVMSSFFYVFLINVILDFMVLIWQ